MTLADEQHDHRAAERRQAFQLQAAAGREAAGAVGVAAQRHGPDLSGGAHEGRPIHGLRSQRRAGKASSIRFAFYHLKL